MAQASAEYVCQSAEGGWRVAGSRVSLDSLVHAYWDGKSPAAINEEFPSLTGEQIYGAIAFYLRHKSEVDEYLTRQQDRWAELQRQSQAENGPLLDRLRAHRQPRCTGEHER